MALPQLGNSKVAGKASDLAKSVSPAKLVSSSFDAVKSSIYSEIPELGGIISSTNSIINDVVSDIRDAMQPIRETERATKDNNESLKVIEDQEIEQTTLFHALATFIDGIHNGLNDNQTPWLMMINEKMDVSNDNTNLTNEILKNIWDVSDNQYEMMQNMLRFDKEQASRAKFEQQKDDANTLLPKLDLPTNEGKKKGSKFFLFGALQKLFAPILGGLTSIFGFLGLSKIFKSLTKSKAATIKLATKFADVTADTAKAVGRFGKIFGAFGKTIATLARTFGKFLGPIGIVITILEGVIGGIKGGIKAFQAGEGFTGVMKGILIGAATQIIQGFADLAVMALRLFGADVDYISFDDIFNFFTSFKDNIKKVAMDKVDKVVAAADLFADSFVKGLGVIGDMFSKAWEGLKEHFRVSKYMFTREIKNVVDSVLNLPKSILMWFSEKLPEPIKKILDVDKLIDRLDLSKENSSKATADRIHGMESNIDNRSIETNNIINNHVIEQMLNGQSSYQQPSILNAPITSIDNSTIIKGNIKTRNPESPLFLSNKVMQ